MNELDQARELYDMLNGLKRQIEDNVDQGGACQFNFEHIKMMLALTKMTLEKSIEEFKME